MGFFSATKNVLVRELRRIARYPVYVVLMFVLPIVSLLFFAAIFQDGVPKDISIAVLDEDNTPLSRTLVSMIDATKSAEVAYRISDMAEGEKMLKQAKIMAVVQIPSNFEKNILGGRGTKVSAYISGVNLTANGMLAKDIQGAAVTFSTGIQLQLLMSKGMSEKQAYAQAMPVYFDKHVLFNPYTNYGYYLLPSFMSLMLMIFSILLTVFSIGSELKTSTAGEWFATANGRTWAALVGKLIPHTLALFLISLFMNTVMYKWSGVPLNGSVAILIISAFMLVLAYQSIAILIITILANMRLGLSIGGGYSVLAFTFSGLTFPLVAMSKVLQVLCYIFPFTVYTKIFVDQAMRGAPIVYSIQDMGWLSLYILLPLLCLPRLKKVATNEKYWGKL